MYGFSDQPNGIPDTRLRADRQGSSRYSATMAHRIEQVFSCVDVGFARYDGRMERRQILAIARAGFGILVIVAIAYQAKGLIDGGFFRPLRFFAFFTILSNLFGAVLFLVLAARWRATRTHTF